MAIVSKVRLMVLPSTGADTFTKDKWADNLKNMAARMKESIDQRIPTAEAFGENLAGPSSEGFRDVINSDFVSRSGQDQFAINASQSANLARSFDKFKQGLDHAFEEVEGEPAKRFKEKVDLRKEAWSEGMADRTIPFSGINRYSKGLSKLAGLWLTGDSRTEGMMRGGDEIVLGTTKRICTMQNRTTLRTLLNLRLIQAGATLVKENWGASFIEDQNDRLNEIVDGFRDPAENIAPFATDAESHVDWVMIDGQPFLEVQIGVTP